jgi:DNA gyrase subunit A
VISEKGFGKRTDLDDENGEPIYRITNRGGKGVKTMNLTDKTGNLIGLEAVTDEQDLMLITKSGTAIRMAMDTIRVMGRATQGVKLIELQKRNDTLMFGCVVPKEEQEEVTEAPEATAEEATTAEE